MRIKSFDDLDNLLKNPQNHLVDLSDVHIDRLLDITKRIATNLRARFKTDFKFKSEGQDRSDFAQIEIPASMLKDNTCRWVEIRLSNTYPLVAISGESKVSDCFLEEIKYVLEKSQMIVVDQSIFLDESNDSAELNINPKLVEAWYALFDYD